MKIFIQSIVLILVMPIIIFACNNDRNPPVNQGEMMDCHLEMAWDSLKAKSTLIGEWEWEYIDCFWNPEGNGSEYRGLTIEFKSDNSLDVKESGQLTQTSNWKVVGVADLFTIDVDPTVPQLYGTILFCEERVAFNLSYLDGCDNYFKRKE